MYRIMIADDEGIVIDSYKYLLKEEFGDGVLVETAKTGRSVIELAERFRPDIALMDIRMPGINGIDAIKEPDFGPYMRELQRRIKMNWDPPKGNESKRVVLLFKIAKDGRLLSCSVFKSSGLQNADAAALNAVKLAAPFRPLPPEYKGQSIDIQFTFDYNVFGATKY